MLDGAWSMSEVWRGVKEASIHLKSVNASVPDDVKKLVEEKKSALAEGKAQVFTGPIMDQSGKEVVPA